MIFRKILFILTCILSIQLVLADEENQENQENQEKLILKTYYTYKDRDHTIIESFTHLGGIYALEWGLYYLTQRDKFKHKGSLKRYKNNLGTFVFDQDEFIWNWIGHPYTGSMIYLYYRAKGYSQISSVGMTFLQSALFELFIEVYTEPSSIQDLYITPVIGSTIGLAFERLSFLLLNQNNIILQGLGHLINPWTLFWFYEGKIQIQPMYNPKKNLKGISLNASF